MVPDYKLYHGIVLCDLIDVAETDLLIGELVEEGRLSSYIVNQVIGLHIKHSTARLPPWQFTFTRANLLELLDLTKTYRCVFVAFVCGRDGVAVLSIDEITAVIDTSGSDQAWIRVDRSRGKQYAVSGNRRALAKKKPKGVSPIIEALATI